MKIANYMLEQRLGVDHEAYGCTAGAALAVGYGVGETIGAYEIFPP